MIFQVSGVEVKLLAIREPGREISPGGEGVGYSEENHGRLFNMAGYRNLGYTTFF